MGLNISPSIWQSYINAILGCLQSKKYCEAIMDDLILFTPSKESHMNKLEDILSALLKNGLKISPKKCQIFNTSLQYMGNEIFIESKKVCVKPLRNRLEAIQKLQEILTEVTKSLQQTNPDYVLVLDRLYLYYDMQLVTFGIDRETNLVIQFLVFIQPYIQNP